MTDEQQPLDAERGLVVRVVDTAAAASGLSVVSKAIGLVKYAITENSAAKMRAAIAEAAREIEIDERANERVREMMSELRENFERLEERASDVDADTAKAPANDRPTAFDVEALRAEVLEKLGAATNKAKRRLLAAALVNVQSPEVYRMGLVAHLLPLLDELTPLDVRALRAIERRGNHHGYGAELTDEAGAPIDAVFLYRLADIHLIEDQTRRVNGTRAMSYRMTELGRGMLELLRGLE